MITHTKEGDETWCIHQVSPKKPNQLGNAIQFDLNTISSIGMCDLTGNSCQYPYPKYCSLNRREDLCDTPLARGFQQIHN